MLRLSSLLLLAVFASATVAAPVPKAGKAQLLVVTVDAKSGKSQLVLIDEDGSNPKELTDTKSNASYPAWSPDGTKMAFVQYKGGEKAELVVADADGKNPKAILKDFTPAEGGRPAWRPK